VADTRCIYSDMKMTNKKMLVPIFGLCVGAPAIGDIAYSNIDLSDISPGGPGYYSFNATDGFDQFGLSFQSQATGVLSTVTTIAAYGFFPFPPVPGFADMSIYRSATDGTPLELIARATILLDGDAIFEFEGGPLIESGQWYSAVITNQYLTTPLRVSTASPDTPAILVSRAGPGPWDVKPADMTPTSPAMHIEVDPVPAPGAAGLAMLVTLSAARRRRRA